MTTPVSHGHDPVLRQLCVDLLAPALAEPGSVVIDCTLGLGGHSEAILSQIPTALVLGIDRDPHALDRARRRLAPFGDRVRTVHAVFDEIGDVVADLAAQQRAAAPGTAAAEPWGRTIANGTVQGVLMDLGVSSLQIDSAERGFAYSQDAPLDMRMNPDAGPTAADVLNTYDERHLARILRDYGEERFAPRIAKAIVQRREQAPWTTSAELVDLIRAAIPAAARTKGGNPAKRTFQALRIEVNGELETLARALPVAIDLLGTGGRIVVESYHSLEDRIVKRELAAGATVSAPPGLPVIPETDQPYLQLLSRGAVVADEQEVADNPRSASVRLRAAERIRVTPQPKRPRREPRI